MNEINAPKNKFIWAQCKFVIRRVNESPYFKGQISETYENLQGQVEVEDQQIKEPFFPKMFFQKKLKYIRHKFYWSLKRHLPNLKINLQKQYFLKLKQEEQIIELFSEVSAAYIARKQNHYYLEEVQINGQKVKKFNDLGSVLFSDLKFSYSSAKKRKKFVLIVTIAARCIEQEKLIIKTYLSSEIFISPYIKRRQLLEQKESFFPEVNLENAVDAAQSNINEGE